MSDMMMPGGMPPMGPQPGPAPMAPEAQDVMAKWQSIPPERKRAFVAAMTPEVASVLMEILPPVYDDLIIAVASAGPEMVQDEMGPAAPGPVMTSPPMAGGPVPGMPAPDMGGAADSFANAIGRPAR